MKITVRLFAGLQESLPGRVHKAELEVPAGASVAEVAAQLRLDQSKAKLVMVNGRQADLATRLAPGDLLAVFPPIGGG